MRVLLIDDSKTMRVIQKRSLMKMELGEIEFIEGNNGQEGLDKLKEHNYNVDLVLCDINMPVMSGIQTLKNIRANPDSKHIPVVMCTSVADKGQVIEALKTGANNYVIKPFKHEDIESKVRSVLEKAGVK